MLSGKISSIQKRHPCAAHVMLSERINSLPLDFKADTCFHDGKAPAARSRRPPRICWLRAQSWGIPAGAEQQESPGSEQLGKGLYKILLPVKMARYPIFYRPSPSLCMAAALRKAPQTQDPHCTQLYARKESIGEALREFKSG